MKALCSQWSANRLRRGKLPETAVRLPNCRLRIAYRSKTARTYSNAPT